MYYHYYQLDYADNCPEDFLFEAESDEKALEFVAENISNCKYCGYCLSEITEPKIERKGCLLYVSYDTIHTIKRKKWA